jgi:hypothetical protein
MQGGAGGRHALLVQCRCLVCLGVWGLSFTATDMSGAIEARAWLGQGSGAVKLQLSSLQRSVLPATTAAAPMAARAQPLRTHLPPCGCVSAPQQRRVVQRMAAHVGVQVGAMAARVRCSGGEEKRGATRSHILGVHCGDGHPCFMQLHVADCVVCVSQQEPG